MYVGRDDMRVYVGGYSCLCAGAHSCVHVHMVDREVGWRGDANLGVRERGQRVIRICYHVLPCVWSRLGLSCCGEGEGWVEF